MLVEDGVILLKYWFSVSDVEQEKRFRSRAEDPMRRWKLSPNDVMSITKWEDYSRAKDTMFVHTDIPEAPWFEVRSDDKRASRINMISHLLSRVPYEVVEREEVADPAAARVRRLRAPAAQRRELRPGCRVRLERSRRVAS